MYRGGERGIIELTGGDLVFAGGKSLTIAGPGSKQLAISGGNIGAIIHISNGAMVNISDMSFKNSETIIHAFLYNEGTFTLTDSIISANKTTAGATSYGGGIDNYKTGTLSVIDSTFMNNSTSGSISAGGGIVSLGTKGSSDIIRFSTIYGNTSSIGGGILVDQTRYSHMTISSSIIAANSALIGPDILGVLTSGGYNLIENVAGAAGLNASTDRHVTLADLKLDTTLGNNGGPTKTLALLPRSKAIDAVPLQACCITIADASGHNVTITTEQRGYP